MERGGGHEEEVQQPPLPRGDRRGTKEQEDQRGYGVQRRVAERHDAKRQIAVEQWNKKISVDTESSAE